MAHDACVYICVSVHLCVRACRHRLASPCGPRSAWRGQLQRPPSGVPRLLHLPNGPPARGAGRRMGAGQELHHTPMKNRQPVGDSCPGLGVGLAEVPADGGALPWTLDLSALLWALLPPWCCLASCRFPRQSLVYPPPSFRGPVVPRRRHRQLRLVPWCGCCPP